MQSHTLPVISLSFCHVVLPCVPPSHTQGYNGSQLWDTSFAAQALCDAALDDTEVADKVLRKAHSYVEQSQVTDGQISVFIINHP